MENIQLNLLKDEIEKLEKFHQIQILEILVENKASFTENRNGVFVNLIKISFKKLENIYYMFLIKTLPYKILNSLKRN